MWEGEFRNRREKAAALLAEIGAIGIEPSVPPPPLPPIDPEEIHLVCWMAIGGE